jgi:hypothetical protein
VEILKLKLNQEGQLYVICTYERSYGIEELLSECDSGLDRSSRMLALVKLLLVNENRNCKNDLIGKEHLLKPDTHQMFTGSEENMHNGSIFCASIM